MGRADSVVRFIRTIQAVFALGILAIGFMSFVAKGKPLGLFIAAGVALFVAACFEWRLRGFRRSVARVRTELEQIRGKDLERSAEIAERVPGQLEVELASNQAFAHMMAGRAVRLFTRGAWKERKLDIGTAILPNRDFDTFISHVLVESTRVRAGFRVMTKGTITRFARMGMKTFPTTTGDQAFDDAWVVDAEHALAMSVLDAPTRKTLLELQSVLPWMGVASLEATSVGLVLRWPSELSAESAAYLRDLAITVCERIEQAS